MTGPACSNLNPELAQRWFQSPLEFCIDVFEQFALLVVDQWRLMTVLDRDRQREIFDIAAPATGTQRFRKLAAQALRDGQL